MTKNKDIIHIVLASDEKFVQHLAVTITSILINSPNEEVFFHVLHNGLSEESKSKLNEMFYTSFSKIDYKFISLNVFKSFPVWYNRISIIAYSRLKIPSLFPELKRIIYLDCDIVVLKNIRDLWDTNLEGHPIGACLALVNPNYIQPTGLLPNKYLNSGILLMDLIMLRDIEFEAKTKDIISTNQFRNDQDIINLNISGNWRRLHQRWNLFANIDVKSKKKQGYETKELKEAIQYPAIIHYTGLKPWDYQYHYRYRNEYWKYLRLTSFKNYKCIPKNLNDIFQRYAPKRIRHIIKSVLKRLK